MPNYDVKSVVILSGLFGIPESPEREKKKSFLARRGDIPKSLRKREMTEMKRSIFDEGEQVGQGSLSIDPASLYRAFEQVKDG